MRAWAPSQKSLDVGDIVCVYIEEGGRGERCVGDNDIWCCGIKMFEDERGRKEEMEQKCEGRNI